MASKLRHQILSFSNQADRSRSGDMTLMKLNFGSRSLSKRATKMKLTPFLRPNLPRWTLVSSNKP
jgi:hypothetical protein